MPYDEGSSCRPLVLLAIVIAFVMFVFPLFVPFPLTDPDEGLHAAIAQEMVESGNWITPRFLGEVFPDKPILYFWVQAASLRLLGSSEMAVRLPGLFFGFLGAATTGLLARRMFGRRTGWIAGILYATTILPTALAQAASHDVALVPWVNLAILLLWESGQSTNRRAFVACTLGAGLFVGLSILTKGLLGVAIIGLAYGGYLAITWRVKPAVLLQGTFVLLIAAAVASPWYLAMESQQPGFLRYYFLERHVLGFATNSQPHSNQPWWYYLPILLGGGLPWIGYVRWAGNVKGNVAEASVSASRFLWFWLIAWTTFLTLAQSKLATYLWPVFPPLAILAAVAWSRLIVCDPGVSQASPAPTADASSPQIPPLDDAQQRSFSRTFLVSSWTGPIVLPAVVAVLQWTYSIHFAWPVWLAVGLAAAISPLPAVIWRSARWQAGLAAAALSLAAQFAVVMAFVLPSVTNNFSARDLAEYFNRQGRLPTRLLMVEERIGSLAFYLAPKLRADLKDGQLECLFADSSIQLKPGDMIAVPVRRLSKAADYLELGDSHESVGRYRLYRTAKLKPQPKIGP